MSTITSASQTKSNTNNNDADIIFNRANIALARSQQLVASWLSAKSAEELSIESSKTKEELQRLEDELFTPVPEKLGLGAPLPQLGVADGSWNRTELSSNDKLRQQLLGRSYRKHVESNTPHSTIKGTASSRKAAAMSTILVAAAATAPAIQPTPVDDGSKSNDGSDLKGGYDEDDNNDRGKSTSTSTSKRGISVSSASKSKRAASYLDELLADRSKRKRKRQN